MARAARVGRAVLRERAGRRPGGRLPRRGRPQDGHHDIGWHPSPAGNPIIDGAVAWIDCVTEQLHDAGDHHIVVGRVTHLQAGDEETPLLFHRGAYGSFNPH